MYQIKLLCVTYMGVNQSIISSAPMLNSSFYSCSVSSGRIMVG